MSDCPDDMAPRHYRLTCLACGATFEDDEEAFRLSCGRDHPAALLRASYDSVQFSPDAAERGIMRYARWLPVRRHGSPVGAPAVFRSDRLAARLGMRELWLAFSGYWPERGALMEACSFKELEAAAVLGRVPRGATRSLVVSSAGNTGRAFLQTASRLGIPAIVVVPRSALPLMRITVDKHPSVRLVALADGDYADATELATSIASLDSCYPEGGARNVARRDGMGTVVLAAVEAMGRLPDHYVQAVGSGTGAIAAWEMATRLRADGRFGGEQMRLHVIQNQPFAIMHEAWQASSRTLPSVPEAEARRRIDALRAPVLSNRRPPWGITGGLYDALADANGSTYAVANGEAQQAGRMFEELEGCDLDPAAEVALAGLQRALESGSIGASDRVLLNLTGGGSRRLEREKGTKHIEPDMILSGGDGSLVRMESALREGAA